ncbi:MAG TPA: SpvB/TcaC N-terminal domain-containing protein [Candidatus Polarisedimenticolaceae bacterium]|nr:SpvB/TcaC N-terminal domain-containing protein [Candidatus Polarisedimenticolaceae bacterium]
MTAGWNVLPLQSGHAAARLEVAVEPASGQPWQVQELVPIGSGVGRRTEPGIVLSSPADGQFHGREAYFRGFAPEADGGIPAITVGGKPVPSEDGAFAVTVFKDEVGFEDAEDAAPWSVEIVATYPGGRTVARTLSLTRHLAGPESIEGRLLPPRTFSVRPGEGRRIRHDGATLDVEPGSVEAEKDVKVTPLRGEDLPGLDTGLTNVTRGPRRGYRFEPHGSRFSKALRVGLPFDPALLPEGMTEQDVRAFYFDDQAGRWQALPHVTVDADAHLVVSLTDHFTDMIAGTLSLPDHPENSALDPTFFEKVGPADPAERIVLIEPPKASNTGDARAHYAFDLPPGRAGMTPELSLDYSSGGGNGWLGVGWSLGFPSVSVDARWGVPRFDGALETETYALGGEQLNPGGHRGALEPRTAEKSFRFRKEGAFARIVRHGTDPASYWWESTDKNGVVSVFGGTPDTVLADASGRISRWLLREKRDLHGNGMRFDYARLNDPGLPAGTVQGTQLYLKQVQYTTTGGAPGPFTVRFLRDDDLGEPRRPDVQIDGRGGFKEVTGQLLRRIEVAYGAAPVRAWELRYVRGAFEKSLLESITQYGSNGSALATHRFAYHDDIREGDAYVGFGPTETWHTGEDDVRSGPVDAIASLSGSDAGQATALSGYETTHAGGHLYVGFNPDSPTKQGSAGAKVGFTGTVQSQGLLSLTDLNGDSLPDKVFRNGSGTYLRLNRSGPHGPPEFGPAVSIPSLPAISEESTSTFSSGLEAYRGVSVIGNVASGISSASTYFADVNGDGLTDLVHGGTVLFNRLDGDGIPSFEPDSGTSPVPVGPGTVDPAVLPDYGPQIQQILERAALHDTLRRWVAPFPGQVRVTGDVALLSPPAGSAGTDGVRVVIQHNGTERWAATLEDTTPVIPENVDAITVAKGDRIYFRVQSRQEGSHDAVSWDPEIVYQGVPARSDANGLDPWRYKASEDFVFAGRPGIQVKMPFNGRVRLVGDLHKTGVTTDSVTLLVFKNGAQVYADGLDWDDVGDIELGIGFDVVQGDLMELRVRVDSPIDLAKIVWTPSLFYSGPPDGPAPSVTQDGITRTIDRLVDQDGNPLIQLHPAYHADFYPVDGLLAPQAPYVADDDGTITISSHLLATAGTNGVVFMTAKRRGTLVAKRTIFIVNGVVQNRVVDIEVEEDDEIFLDYSCLDPDLAPRIFNRVIQVDGDPAPSAFHTTARQGVFPLAYRGWAVAGYNGNPPRGEQPIAETDLNVVFDKDTELDPRTDKAYLFTPFPEGSVWRGPEDETVVSSGGAQSSRLGPNAVAIPGVGGALSGAPMRLSSSGQTALQVEAALLSGSKSSGDGGSDLDFMDMNGDRFPDVVGEGRIQYSPAIGGLETAGRVVAAVDAVRGSDGDAKTLGVGGSPASFRVGARGQVDTPGRGSAQKENDTRPQMVSLGLSGSLGSGSSSVPFDLVDLNGDGLPDRVTEAGGLLQVAFNLGYGFAAFEPWGTGALSRGTSESISVGTNLGFNGGIYDYAGGISLSRNASETKAMLADVNGDGFPDRLTRNGDRILVGLNVGNRFLADVDWGGAPQGAFATSTDATVGAGAYFTAPIGPLCLVGCWVILNPGVDGSTSLARQESALLDVDGDGDVDHVVSSDDAVMSVARNRTGRTNLLRSIERPLGARIEIDYARDGNTSDQPQSRWVLSRSSIQDGVPGDGVDVQLATFRYENGIWDRLEREFYGYGTVVEEVRDVSQGEAIYRTITRTFATDSFYTRGVLLGERIADGAGRPFKESVHALQIVDVATQAPLADPRSTTATAMPVIGRVDQFFFEGQPAAGKSTTTLQEFDALGNVVRRFDAGDAGPEDDFEELIEYGSCPATHVVGTPVASVVRGNGVELRRRSATLDCATGDLTQITEYLADGTGAETVLEHDALGNLVRLVGPPNLDGQRYEMRYQYDPEVQTYVTQVVDSFGYVSSASWDVALGRRTRGTDIAGQSTLYTYDAHGRLTVMRGPYEQGPGGAAFTVAFEHHPEATVPWSRTLHLDSFRDPADPVAMVRFVDGQRRTLQDKSDAAVFTGAAGAPSDVMVVSGRVRFDAVGRITERWHPVVEPLGTPGVYNPTYDTVNPMRTEYDVVDRPVRTISPDGSATVTTHGFGQNREGVTQFEARILDARGAVASQFKNVRDLLTGMKELNRVGGGVQEIWTSYGYDALRRLIRITDDRSNVTRIAWDNLNRKVSVESPDEGRTEDVYDLAGNRTARVTANLRAHGQQVAYEYAFNRLERIRYPDFPGNDVTYTFGGPGAPGNGAGRVVRIADASGTRERAYGKLGEIVSEIRTIPGTTGSPTQVYTSQYTYDTFNRLQRMVYPDGELLTLRYDSGGRLRQITGRKGPYDYPYLRRMEYDKFGDHAFIEAGNGTRTTYAHRPDNRYLEHVVALRADGRPFVDLTYTYDEVGNVLSRTNAVPVATGSDFGGPSSQTFVYDDLDRMLGSQGTYQFAPGKLDRYAMSLDYDTIHNMRSRSQHHEIVQPSGSAVRQGKTSYLFTYAYGGPQPHAATHIGERSFAYDGNGNQLGWQHDVNGTRRTIAWDEENRMQSLFENGHEIRFVYDDQGERTIKRGPQGETVYVSPWLTVRNGTTGTKHVWAGTMRIASKLMKQDRPGGNPSGDIPLEKDQYFFHADHTGTTNFVSDAGGRLYEHLEYFPFGETWVQESSNTQRTPYLFTGKELDEETGLAYLGARYLDPRLGSFNSGEPLLFEKPEKARNDARFLSVYAYAYQNPERFLDPDGRDVIIVVGDPGNDRESRTYLQKGYPAAAQSLKATLAKKGIKAHIIEMTKTGSVGALDAIRAKAAAVGDVKGLVYIGHGEVSGMKGIMPKGDKPVTVKEAADAAGLKKGGTFVVYGCDVSTGQAGLDDLKGRGINVLTTTPHWTYTTVDGRVAFGTPKKKQTEYGSLARTTMLRNITKNQVATDAPLVSTQQEEEEKKKDAPKDSVLWYLMTSENKIP